MDVTKRSIFLTSSQKYSVNTRINKHLSLVRGRLLRLLQKANLYVSGSLALGEPAFSDRETLTLRSDIDLLIISDGPRPSLEGHEKLLQQLSPDYRDTLYWLPASVLSRLQSPSARNLFEGMRQPLHEAVSIAPPPPMPLDPVHFLPSIIYQIVGVWYGGQAGAPVKSPSSALIWHQPPSYHLLKLGAELLKFCACLVGGPYRSSIRDAYDLRAQPQMRHIIDPQTLEQVVWSRESGAECDGLEETTRRLLGAALRQAARIDDADDFELVETYFRLVYNRPGLVYLFGPIVLSTYFAEDRTAPQASRLLDFTSTLLRRLADDPLLDEELQTSLRHVSLDSTEAAGNFIGKLKGPYIREKLRLKDSGVKLWLPMFRDE